MEHDEFINMESPQWAFVITTALPYERRANKVLSVYVSRLWGGTIRGVDLPVFRALTFSFGIIFSLK